MERKILVVPKGIRYLSEWSSLPGGYSLENYPFPHMVNKQITGCGFTEYCITNNLDVIVCSPRKILLENKEDQHQGEVFYFRNEFENMQNRDSFDLDISITPSPKEVERLMEVRESTKEELDEIEDRRYILKRNLLEYMDRCRQLGKPIKILVTYDSFHLVRDFIKHSDHFTIDNFYVIIDEFQSVFTDSRFKSDTELGFLNELKGGDINKICFVSATPMLDKYLEMLSEFKNLPYYEFDWKTEDETRVIKPVITVRSSKSLISDAKSVINSYLSGEFEKYTYIDPIGEIRKIESREAVLYFNSVKNICDVIRKCNLTPDNTNILCSNSLENQKNIRKAFKDSCGRKDGGIGFVPKRGEQHKMFTLCTRTVYLGADFYSTNARSFVFSDPNIDCLSVDISLDLPQILGRQRLNINPWKSSATLFYKTIRNGKKLGEDEFNKTLSDKQQESITLIDVANGLDDLSRETILKRYELLTKISHYKNDYVSVNHDADGNLIPVFNNLVMVAEMRAFDIQQVDYKDRFSVFNCLEASANSVVLDSVDKLLSEFEIYQDFPSKLKFVCDIVLNNGLDNVMPFINSLPISYRNFILTLGPERCAAFSYRKHLLEKEISKTLSLQESNIGDIIHSTFEVGKVYSLSNIKSMLKDIYESAGEADKSAKATDLEKYFNVRPTMILMNVDGEKKKVKVFEILSIK